MHIYRKAGLAILIGSVIILILWAISAGRLLGKAVANDLPVTHIITSEDSSLISGKYIGSVQAYENINSKVRSPVSFLNFDNIYPFVIYKIDSTGRKSLPDLLQIKTVNSERTEDAVYTQVDLNSLSSFQWRSEAPHMVSKIHVLLGGDSVTMVVANDSVVCYHLLCQSLSIRFSEEGPVEVYLTGVDKSFGRAAITPADILFLKRNEAVYLLIMTPGRDDGNIPAQLLYNVVMGL